MCLLHYYFNVNGNPTPLDHDTCKLVTNQWCSFYVDEFNRIPAGTLGSALVDGGQDVTVVVEHNKNGWTERTNYNSVLTDGNNNAISRGWERAGAVLYAPIIKRQSGGRSSAIYLTNVGTVDTTVSVQFFNSSGAARSAGTWVLRPNQRVDVYSSYGSGSGGCDAPNTLCSARITASNSLGEQPLVGVIHEYRDSDGLVAAMYNLFSEGATAIYFPVVKYSRSAKLT
jgi:hypothetical protein